MLLWLTIGFSHTNSLIDDKMYCFHNWNEAMICFQWIQTKIMTNFHNWMIFFKIR